MSSIAPSGPVAGAPLKPVFSAAARHAMLAKDGVPNGHIRARAGICGHECRTDWARWAAAEDLEGNRRLFWLRRAHRAALGRNLRAARAARPEQSALGCVRL